MNGTCQKCSARLESPWKFCPLCGAANAAKIHEAAPPPEHEKPPVKGAFSGLFLGSISVPVLVISGSLICLTGLGVFLGVPLIIAGICAPLVGALMGMNALKGKCPWCEAAVSGVGIFDRFSCPACSKQIVVKKQEMLRAE